MKDDSYIDFFFFFQAEDGIRDLIVTGVQTCALPICSRERREAKTSFLNRLQRQRGAETREHTGPGEVRQGEYRVEGGELGHAPVEPVRSVAEQDRVAEGLDHITHSQPDGYEEEGEAASRSAFDAV